VTLLLHAPNVHVGGGMLLLRQFVAATGGRLGWAQLDERARNRLEIPPGTTRYFVKRSVAARAVAEWRLWRISAPDSVVLCFHGMPPWLPVRGRVVVFQHNRNLFGVTSLRRFPARVALRIAAERILCRMFRGHVAEYVVQTPHMQRDLERWAGEAVHISMMPFADLQAAPPKAERGVKGFDFVYVASGDAHKNHLRLLDAWLLLGRQGIFPSLALTVEPDNQKIVDALEALRREHDLRLTNLGILDHQDVLALYAQAGALIFPSLGESLGLPLLEAAHAGLPIIASERDYVRDVVTPAETFDPESSVSIARAVRRFLQCPESPVKVVSAGKFVGHLLRS
jgi:glycosyltransferase involved in cell wall biosynthesis